MNKEFKVGDVVVLVEGEGYLTNLARVLVKEKHLFEVESLWNNYKVNLKSINTNLRAEVHVGNVRHATLKEQYLRTGNSIIIDDIGYLVLGNKIVGLKSGFRTDYFCDDLLTVSERKPITKVFNSPNVIFENKIDVNHFSSTVLWERKPKIELTSDEVIILKNIDEKYKYIARNTKKNDGVLIVYEKEPKKDDDYDVYVTDDLYPYWERIHPFYHIFQNITFESGVHLIDDLIKENENENKLN